MPAKQEPTSGLNYGWDAGESGINLQLDENWRAIGNLLNLSVESMSVNPPGTPTEGERYIVPSGATGSWSGHGGKVARFIEDEWEMYTPREGWVAWVSDIGQFVRHDGTQWLLPGELYNQHPGDSAAATGGIPVGGFYVNSSTGALTVRLT